jgi:hypothetical protein
MKRSTPFPYDRVITLVVLALFTLSLSCAAADVAANLIGKRPEGESQTLAYKVLTGAGKLAPNWAYNAILALTTALGFYRDHRKKKSFELVAGSIERGRGKIEALKDEIVSALENQEYDEVKKLILSGDRFDDILAEFTKGKPFYADMMRMIEKVRKQMKKKETKAPKVGVKKEAA